MEIRERPQRPGIYEPLAVFVLIVLYIWWLRRAVPYAWAPLVCLVLASHRLRRERAAALGFRVEGLGPCAREVAPALILIALALLSAGILLGTTRPISFDQGLVVLLAYCPWGLFQQYLLNGYFVNRLAAAWPGRGAVVLSAALFAGAHFPNWFLMPVTFAAGYASARLFLKHRNLFVLGAAHGAIGFLLYFTIPDWVIRNLTVGPGWFR